MGIFMGLRGYDEKRIRGSEDKRMRGYEGRKSVIGN
jgi:hypothetical protein